MCVCVNMCMCVYICVCVCMRSNLVDISINKRYIHYLRISLNPYTEM